MTIVCGVDGCRGGWVAVRRDLARPAAAMDAWGVQVAARFVDVLAPPSGLEPPSHVAVDMPIGLLDASPPPDDRVRARPCDRLARARLGPRRSSVFNPPLRDMLTAPGYEAVRSRGLSVQAWHLVRKIAEVDAAVPPGVQGRVREVHPELAFAGLTGAPMAAPKRRSDGLAARREAVLDLVGVPTDVLDEALAATRRSVLARDDLYDAAALAWSAARMAAGTAEFLGGELDGTGRRMEIGS